MKKKKLIIIISSAIVLILLSSLTYKCINNYCMERDETLLYKKALQPDNNKDNPFSSQAQLSFYDSVLTNPAIGFHQFTVTQYFKAMSLIKLGKEKDAIEILQAIIQRTNKKEPAITDARKYLALAYLRLGERNNCVMNHSSGSCIFPIKDKGVYTDLYASQKAIEAYQ
ncbi:MAG TPA: hypothetical protein VK787_15975, partial [Puia sp.]|nr:hypothetical protein [Puia sp.]